MKNIITIILSICILCGYGVSTIAAEQPNYPIKFYNKHASRDYNTLLIIDETTGVNYIGVSSDNGGSYKSVSLCPRYNKDGTLYVSEETNAKD